MRRSTTPLLLLAVLLALAALPGLASANAMDDRIAANCERGPPLHETYTKAQLRHAQRNLPSDVLEYSGCYDAIRQALLAPAGGDGTGDGDGTGGFGSSGSGGVGGTSGSSDGGGTATGGDPGAPSTPPHTGTRAPVAIAGATIEPGELPSIGQDANALPSSLAVLLVLLSLAAIVPAALMIGRRVVARRRA